MQYISILKLSGRITRIGKIDREKSPEFGIDREEKLTPDSERQHVDNLYPP
jgi:hypothetical protein